MTPGAVLQFIVIRAEIGRNWAESQVLDDHNLPTLKRLGWVTCCSLPGSWICFIQSRDCGSKQPYPEVIVQLNFHSGDTSLLMTKHFKTTGLTGALAAFVAFVRVDRSRTRRGSRFRPDFDPSIRGWRDRRSGGGCSNGTGDP